jgi:hypothetical protein
VWSRLRIQDERRVEGRWCAMELARPGAAAERLDGLQSTSAWPSSARLSRYACIPGVVTQHPCLPACLWPFRPPPATSWGPSCAFTRARWAGPWRSKAREIHFSSGR